MKHVEEAKLALYAGGDLALWPRMRVLAHLRRCAFCRAEAVRFAETRAMTADAGGDLPPGLDWNALSREMTGNILVGLEAGECVEGYSRGASPRRHGWNLALAAGAACLLVAAGVWMNFPGRHWDQWSAAFSGIVHPSPEESPSTAAVSASPTLEASRSGIGVSGSDGALRLMTPRGQEVTAVSVSLQGSATANYVDADSGQITIDKVYDAR